MTRKLNTTKLVALLAVLCMITSAFVGSTLAKYTTSGKAEDNARVAEWGVKVTTNTDTAFGTAYADTNSDDGFTNTVEAEVDVVAPGTAGTLISTTVTGAPEVAVSISRTADLTLTGWTDANGDVYCPIVFTVGNEDIKIDGTTITTLTQLEEAVENKVKVAATKLAANTNLGTTYDVTVTWAWNFDGNDANDTYLGDQAALNNASKIAFTSTTTVTQLD